MMEAILQSRFWTFLTTLEAPFSGLSYPQTHLYQIVPLTDTERAPISQDQMRHLVLNGVLLAWSNAMEIPHLRLLFPLLLLRLDLIHLPLRELEQPILIALKQRPFLFLRALILCNLHSDCVQTIQHQ
jgi:hypothetical protein